MIFTIPSQIDTVALMTEICGFDYERDDTGVLMAFRQSVRIGKWVERTPTIAAAIKEISDHREATAIFFMVNVLHKKACVPAHTDKLAHSFERLERWHLPLYTNLQAHWWDELHGTLHLEEGIWYGPMPYWLSHKVSNDSAEKERVHIVVDLEKAI